MKRVIVTLTIGLAFQSLIEQPSLQKMKEAIQQKGEVGSRFKVELNSRINTQATIKFSTERTVQQSDVKAWLSEQLQFRPGKDEIRATGKLKTIDNIIIEKFRQYYKGIKVENGSASVMSSKGKVGMVQIEFYPIEDELNIKPSITEADALKKAMGYIGAKKYIWENGTGKGPADTLPKGELVIIKDDTQQGKMCLNYKFRIYAEAPRGYYFVYINSLNGNMIYIENLIHAEKKDGDPHSRAASADSINVNTYVKSNSINKIEASRYHFPSIGLANTRYSGNQQELITDDESGVLDKPYRLQALNYNFFHDIITKNYENRRTDFYENDGLALDFLDDNDNWNEYADVDKYSPNATLSGIDAHFNMQLISDYWLNRHDRNSWDGQGAAVIQFVNVIFISNGEETPNAASWNPRKKVFYFGNGDYSREKPIGHYPHHSLDNCAHEFAHAVCQGIVPTDDPDDPGLKNEGEPGALGEGLSDIWAACAGNYFNERFPNLPPKKYWLYSAQTTPDGTGVRDIQNPNLKGRPDTYKGPGWITDIEYDNGGIHANGSVLSKWFSLITEGGNGVNGDSYEYSVAGMGFEKSEKVVYLMEAMLPNNADYETAKNASIGAAEELFYEFIFTDADTKNIKKAWGAVGLGYNLEVYDMSNTPNFVTNAFTAISVGKDGHVWAGTNKRGLYKFDGNDWEKTSTAISDYQITDMAADKNGGIWIAESGRETQLHAGGGVFYYPGPSLLHWVFFDTLQGLPSRNVQSIFIDTAFKEIKSRLWVAYLAQNNATSEASITKGGIACGLMEVATDKFIKITSNFTEKESGAQAIGGNVNEVWAYVRLNTPANIPQVLRYDSKTLDYIGAYDQNNTPELGSGFLGNAIYFDEDGNKWLGMTNGGCKVLDVSSKWHSINFEKIFPPPVIIQNNAITGDAIGQVYIGTDSGLIIYETNIFDGTGIEDEKNYKRLTINDGLPSNSIKDICIDTLRRGIWIATNNGVAFMPRENGSNYLNITKSEITSSGQQTCSSAIELNFKTSGSFYNGPIENGFVIELSDANGSFNDPIPLYTISEAPTGDQEYLLPEIPFPPDLPVSTHYKIKVKSTNPKVVAVSDELPPLIKIVPTSPGTKGSAASECTDAGGWTNYYDENGVLILSLKLNGNNIDKIENGLWVSTITTPNANSFLATEVLNPAIKEPYWSMNRYWEVNTTIQPMTNVGVRFYYNDQDLYDINGSVPNGPVDHTQLVFYKVNSDPDPTKGANWKNIKSIMYNSELSPSTSTWRYTKLGNGIHMAEFEVSSFSGGGGGMTLSGGPLTSENTFTIKSGNWSDPTTWNTGIVPTDGTDVLITHNVTVDIDANCKSLKLSAPGIVNVNSGLKLNILNE